MHERSTYGIRRGENHPQVKLSDADVRLVRALHQQTDLGYPSCVRNIVTGRQRGD